ARPSGLNLGGGLDQLAGQPQLAEYPKGTRLRGFRRSADYRGHLSERKVEVVMEDEQQALVCRQLGQRAPQVQLQGKRVAPGRTVGVGIGEPDHRPPAATAQGAALVGNDGEEPGPDVTAGAKRAELPPGLEHRVLHCVLGVLPALEHRHGQPERICDVRCEEVLEGAEVPFLCTLEQPLRERHVISSTSETPIWCRFRGTSLYCGLGNSRSRPMGEMNSASAPVSSIAAPTSKVATVPNADARAAPTAEPSGMAPQTTVRHIEFIRPRKRSGVRDCRSVTWSMLATVSVITPMKNTTVMTAAAGRTRASGRNASATGNPANPIASDGPTPNRVVAGLTTATPAKAPRLLSITGLRKCPA